MSQVCKYKRPIAADLTEGILSRFWSRVHKGEGNNACWVYQGKYNHFGYGIFPFRAGTPVSSHIVSWLIHKGDTPKGKCILHTCDNPPCVRPSHLFIGTRADNDRDRDQKGRQARGIKNGAAKLTEAKVRRIRSLYASGLLQTEIAKQFGIYQTTVSSIVMRKRWAHVGG